MYRTALFTLAALATLGFAEKHHTKPHTAKKHHTTKKPCETTACVDYINDCGQTYGGCYEACKGYVCQDNVTQLQDGRLIFGRPPLRSRTQAAHLRPRRAPLPHPRLSASAAPSVLTISTTAASGTVAATALTIFHPPSPTLDALAAALPAAP